MTTDLINGGTVKFFTCVDTLTLIVFPFCKEEHVLLLHQTHATIG